MFLGVFVLEGFEVPEGIWSSQNPFLLFRFKILNVGMNLNNPQDLSQGIQWPNQTT